VKEFSTKYMYDNEWTEKASKFFSKDHIEKTKPYVVKVKNGIILPERPGDLPWGLGGCLDEAGNLIPESTVNGAYGGKYNFDENSIEKLDETVVLIPMIPKHWGHFIIDVISRLWIFLDDRFDTKNLKIYYCAFGWGEKKLSGNYLRFMEYLGIADRLIQVDHPIQAKEVWVPSFTMSYRISCNEEYKVPVEYVIQKVLASDKVKNLEPYEKIYFTRTHFATSQLKEIGEIDIEKTMQSNGYHILSPEKLNFEEQIYYIHQCKVMMAMSGTITHNIVFSNPEMKLYIINRTCVPNPPQLLLNRLYENEIYFVDAYRENTLKHPKDYGFGPFWVTTNENFQNFCKDHQITIPDEILHHSRMHDWLKYEYALAVFNAKYNKFTIFVYYKMKKILGR